MSKKTKIILAVFVLALLGLIIAVMLSDQGAAPTANNNLNLPVDQPTVVNTLSLPASIPTEQPLKVFTPTEQKVYNTAKNFAERYASFSTDSRFVNLEEVKIFASSKMDQELTKLINHGQTAAEFYGVTSNALNVEISDFDEATGTCEATVYLQRQETQAGKPSRVYYQNLRLFLIKEGDNWLVDEAKWLP